MINGELAVTVTKIGETQVKLHFEELDGKRDYTIDRLEELMKDESPSLD